MELGTGFCWMYPAEVKAGEIVTWKVSRIDTEQTMTEFLLWISSLEGIWRSYLFHPPALRQDNIYINCSWLCLLNLFLKLPYAVSLLLHGNQYYFWTISATWAFEKVFWSYQPYSHLNLFEFSLYGTTRCSILQKSVTYLTNKPKYVPWLFVFDYACSSHLNSLKTVHILKSTSQNQVPHFPVFPKLPSICLRGRHY